MPETDTTDPNPDVMLLKVADLVSVTSGRLVSREHMDGVYAVCEFFAGGPVWTHQLPRVAESAGPVILAQHPQLRAVPDGVVDETVLDSLLAGDDRETACVTWVEGIEAAIGATELLVDRGVALGVQDPVAELVGVAGEDRVVAVLVDPS